MQDNRAIRAVRFLSHVESLSSLASYLVGLAQLPTGAGLVLAMLGADTLAIAAGIGVMCIMSIIATALAMRAQYLRREREMKERLDHENKIAALRNAHDLHMAEHHAEPPSDPTWPFGVPMPPGRGPRKPA